MRRVLFLGLAVLAFAAPAAPLAAAPSSPAPRDGSSEEALFRAHTLERLNRDLAALERHRPGYSFWQHVFRIPDGAIAFGSAEDGRLLASFPSGGDWDRGAKWADGSLAGVLDGLPLPRRLTDRRDRVAEVLEPAAGRVVHNPTRGDFLLPNARRYGGFLSEWGAIYERFGVPAELGLAQAVVESGLSGTVKSEARAIGFCQWLPSNWNRLKRLASAVIEAENQTTQAPYCAAYLTVLATKYGTFIPALSEHHAGGTNVGRTVINGSRLGGEDVREQYFLGAELARDLRALAPRTFRQLVGSYGPRSFLYAEMVFGNTHTVKSLREETPQERIFAMRAPRAIALAEVSRRTGLSTEEVRRFNPALVRQVPKGANLYLPMRVDEFGPDVSFWHGPAPAEYAAVLNEFVRLQATPDEWNDPAFDAVLRDFRRRFRETGTEEGEVMDVVLAYVMQEMPTSRRILREYTTSPRIREQFEEGVQRRAAALVSAAL